MKTEHGYWEGDTSNFTWARAKQWHQERSLKETPTMTTTHTELRRIPLDALVLSQTPIQIERRAQFNPDALKELSATIKAVGRVEHAITVRRVINTSEGGGFEIADGERRVLATEMAGLEEILAEVRELTDEQVEQMQIVTGLQKEGLHELVEAEGYETLQKRGLSIEEIAAKCGKKPGVVYARIKLLALCPEARTQFRDGKIGASVALLIARIPLEKLQKEALKEITARKWPHMEGMSYREAAEFVQRQYMLRLDQAPFKTGDADLVPKAGACGTCPKNTSCQPELFADVSKKALCTDPGCFNEKREAAIALKVEAAKVTGQLVITGKEAKKLAPHGEHSIRGGYERLEAMCSDDPKRRTYRQLLGRNAKPALLEVEGKLVEVVNEAETLKQLKASGVLKAVKRTTTPTRSSSGSAKAASAKAQRDEEIESEVTERLFRAVHTKAPKQLPRAALESLIERSVDMLDVGDEDILAALWGWKHGLPQTSDLKKLSEPQLHQVLFEITVLLDAYTDGGLAAVAKSMKIDEKKIRAEVVASLKPPAPAKASKKGSRK